MVMKSRLVLGLAASARATVRERVRKPGVRSVSSAGLLEDAVGHDFAADESGSMIWMGIRRRFGGGVAGSVCGWLSAEISMGVL